MRRLWPLRAGRVSRGLGLEVKVKGPQAGEPRVPHTLLTPAEGLISLTHGQTQTQRHAAGSGGPVLVAACPPGT